MKQQYRSVCFRETELLGKNKKQSVIESNTANHSTTQDSNRQLTPRPPSTSALPVTLPVAQSTVPVINKRQPQDSNRQLTPRPPSPSALPVTLPVSQSTVTVINKRQP